jgi:hypothetical protein
MFCVNYRHEKFYSAHSPDILTCSLKRSSNEYQLNYLVNPDPIEWPLSDLFSSSYLQINTVKYNADQENTNTYENLQIVWSKFFIDKLTFV